MHFSRAVPASPAYERSFTTYGSRGPHVFSFPITDGSDIELYFNQTLQSPATYTVAAAAEGFSTGGSVTINSTSPAPLSGSKITIRRPAKTSTFTGNGSQTVFAFTFAVTSSGDVEARINNVEQASDFTVRPAPVGGFAAGGTVTFATPPAKGAAVVIRRAGYTGYLTTAYTANPKVYSLADLAKRRDLTFQRTTVVGRLVAMTKIMHEELHGADPTCGTYVQDGGVPAAGERWFNKLGVHKAPVYGPITTRSGTGAYTRPGSTPVLASGTLWTVYDYLTHNNGEVLDYLKNGGPYPVIDVHGHHAYCLSRNFGAATFGGYTIGGKTIDANDVSKFQNMETVRYAVPATNRAGPYAFTFSIQQSINLEVWLNNVKQTTGFKVTAAPGGLANGGSVTFTTIPDAGAILLLRAGLSQNAQITQCPEHVAAAFKVANALRVAAGKSAVPGFVYVHDESGLGTTTGASTETLPPIDGMSASTLVQRCGPYVTAGWASSYTTSTSPAKRYEPEQILQMLRAYRWHQIILGPLWYAVAHHCTYTWTASKGATDRMDFVYVDDTFKQGGKNGNWSPSSRHRSTGRRSASRCIPSRLTTATSACAPSIGAWRATHGSGSFRPPPPWPAAASSFRYCRSLPRRGPETPRRSPPRCLRRKHHAPPKACPTRI